MAVVLQLQEHRPARALGVDRVGRWGAEQRAAVRVERHDRALLAAHLFHRLDPSSGDSELLGSAPASCKTFSSSTWSSPEQNGHVCARSGVGVDERPVVERGVGAVAVERCDG